VAGGPAGDYLDSFIKHSLEGTNHATGETGTPLDFISFHAKGSPRHINGHVRMGIANQLRDIDAAFEVIANYPDLKDTPIIIGESDPEGCAACQGPNLAYRNGTMYSSYTAASFVRKLDLEAKHDVNLEGALTWAFEFENQPYFAGFRALATNGINKPVLNVFRMMSKLEGSRLAVQSTGARPLDDILQNGIRKEPDVHAVATRSDDQLAVMAWHYHDDDLPGDSAAVILNLRDFDADGKNVRHYRIDESHSNAYVLWRALGSPQEPTEAEISQMKEADGLTEMTPAPQIQAQDGNSTIELSLPRKAVSLIVIEEAS
jgi:xylan 1,4-beta-xylosidase